MDIIELLNVDKGIVAITKRIWSTKMADAGGG
jgi:hypothetical protein